jgi:ATP-dependent DNA helicase RecQ
VPDLLPHLRELFGFDGFRPGQEPVVRAALDGRDTLALMPTGSGKSLTYQLAAMLRPEPTLVLSPLIALMKDQVDKLPPQLAETATFVNSSLAAEETASRLAAVAAGRTRLLYAAPERLRQSAFVETLRAIRVGLVVVDEVHCVSMWGHDFRPDYLHIRRALSALGGPALLGMTATATPATADEISGALGRELEVVRTSVVRPNLRYDVQEAANAEERLRILVERLGGLHGSPAIVYARSRRSTETLARVLSSHGFRAHAYHAGLEAEERTRVQDAFVAGTTQVVTATTAFGMGIDKPDVRLVALVNHPDSLESYVQMVGRAGRDGEPSDTLLLVGAGDAASLRRFSLADVPRSDDLRAVYRELRDAGGRIDPELLSTVSGDHDPRVLVGMLEQAGLLSRGYDEGRLLTADLPAPPADAAARVDELLRRYRRVAESRAERMIGFGESDRCRHAQVAEHFGEELDGPCGRCDVCAPPTRRASQAGAAPPLPGDVAGAIVRAVAGLAWPLGRRSLVATLRGSIAAPPSARRSHSFGILAAASESEVTRWIRALETAGALVETVTPDGYRVLRAMPDAPRPHLGPVAAPAATGTADAGLVGRLRAWRLERSRSDGVPAYVVLHDATLEELAAARPSSIAELASVRGLGPAKLERYGEDLLALLAAA